MQRRPIGIIIIAICYFLFPFAILVQASVSAGLPFFGPGNLFSTFRGSAIAILVLYPASGIALLSARRWGWYLFLGCSAALIAYSAGAYVIDPRYARSAYLIATIAIVVVSAILFRSQLASAYSTHNQRWWESDMSYRIEARAQIKVGEAIVTGEILDISRSGCFVNFILDLAIGETYRMYLKCLTHSFDIDAKVVRKSSKFDPHEGYGFMFVKPTREQKEEVESIVAELERGGLRDYIRDQEMIPAGTTEKGLYRGVAETEPRYNVFNRAVLADGTETHLGMIVDISKTGCLLKCESDLPEGASFTVTVHSMKMRFSSEGKIDRKVEIDGKKGYSLRFHSLPRHKRRELMKLFRVLRKVGAKHV